ncbi:MAG: hypothetical protein DRN25_05605 [Thermoplasmata archaeon]|nr:MAG: hypothetical protein DRN25_05605 [Thermoplasmata archaeon]
MGNDVKNKTLITYKVRTSPDMSGKAVFSGIVKTLKGVNEIIGDKELIVVKKSIIEEREREKKICGASFILLLAFLLYFISKKFLRMV